MFVLASGPANSLEIKGDGQDGRLWLRVKTLRRIAGPHGERRPLLGGDGGGATVRPCSS